MCRCITENNAVVVNALVRVKEHLEYSKLSMYLWRLYIFTLHCSVANFLMIFAALCYQVSWAFVPDINVHLHFCTSIVIIHCTRESMRVKSLGTGKLKWKWQLCRNALTWLFNLFMYIVEEGYNGVFSLHVYCIIAYYTLILNSQL